MLTGETKWLRGASDAESVVGDELRVPRRRKSPSDPTSREIEDHVLTGHASFRLWCAACVQGSEVEPRDTREKAARSCKMVRRYQSSLRIVVSFEPGIEPVKLKWNSVEAVQSW